MTAFDRWIRSLWFTRALGLLMLVGLALLLLATAVGAQTWPRDVTGTPAAQCSALDANGAPQLCGPSNPLPVSGGGAISGGTGTSSAGQNWFLAQPPGFNPFILPDGTSNGRTVFMSFLDDINLVGFQGGNPNNTVGQFRSADGGKTWTTVSQSAALCGGFQIDSVVKVPGPNGYAFLCGGAGLGVFFTGDGIQFTNRTATGAQPGGIRNAALNVSTILVASPDVSATTNDTICRSADNGTSWNCATMPAITGWTSGASGFSIANGVTRAAQAFEGLAANIWLVAGNSKTGVGKILRSTDDGVNWTEVFSGGSAIAVVQCLTSTLCLSVRNQEIFRSTNGGVSWTTVVSTGPAGAATNWNAVIPFSDTVAVVAPFAGANSGTVARVHFYRTVDAGLTWSDIPAAPCARDNGVAQNVASVAFRNGRAVVQSSYSSLTFGSPCVHYSSLGTGGTAVTGPLGVPWAITAEGFGPVAQGNPQIPFSVAPGQGVNLFNSQTTGAANTAVVVTIAAVADQRAHVDRVEASCAPAGTASLTITDGGVTVWSTVAAEVGVARFRQPFTPKSLTGTTQSAVVITLATCGVGNAGTLIVHADRF